MNFEPEAVRAFEHAGWQRAAAEYDASFAHASARFAEALLDAAGVGPGAELLDLCCGTGLVAAAAARRGAASVGLDFSAAMLEEARRAHPLLRFDEGDAEAPPYPDRSFAAIVSNFGIHHVPRPEEAIGEAVRMLRPGGRVAFTTWAEPSENIGWRLVFDAVRAHGDPQAASAPPSGGDIGTPQAMRDLLRRAGLAEVEAALVRREWVVAEPRRILAALLRGTVRTAAVIAAQPAASLTAIEAAVAEAVSHYRSADGYAVPIAAILARGVKPET